MLSDIAKERAIVGLVVDGQFWRVADNEWLIPPEAFYDDLCRLIYSGARDIALQGRWDPTPDRVNEWLEKNGRWKKVEAIRHGHDWKAWHKDPDIDHSLSAAPEPFGLIKCAFEDLQRYHANRQERDIRKLLSEDNITLQEATERLSAIAKVQHGKNGDSFDWTEFNDRAFRMDCLHTKPAPMLRLAGHSISTEGNLTNIFAQAKAGKSAVIGAIIGAVITLDPSVGDYLSWSAEPNLNGKALLHFDTEQSRYDHEQIVIKALRRASLTEEPPWLHSYCLTGIPTKRRREFVKVSMEKFAQIHGGIYGVLIDGVGDYVLSVNDQTESDNLIAEFHAQAIEFSTIMALVLHENPTSPKDWSKGRGHLGSQMERKGESNVKLDRDPKTEITTQYSEKSRHASIPKAKGPQFVYHPQEDMHITHLRTAAKKKPKESDIAFVHSLFRGVIGGMEWKPLLDKIAKEAGISLDGAEKRFEKYRELQLIVKNTGGYYAENQENT